MTTDGDGPVERHRAALEALAEHGRTDLAKDARDLLADAEAGAG